MKDIVVLPPEKVDALTGNEDINEDQDRDYRIMFVDAFKFKPTEVMLIQQTMMSILSGIYFKQQNRPAQ